MKNIEIPYAEERGKRYRLFEILPGFLSWTFVFAPLWLALISPTLSALFIIGYFLIWFTKNLGMAIRTVQGVSAMNKHTKLPWLELNEEIQNLHTNRRSPSWHAANIIRLEETRLAVKPNEVVHAVIIAAFNESSAVLEPTIQSLLDSDYDKKKIILVLAYEARGGRGIEKTVNDLVSKYGNKFKYAMAVKHPEDIPGEVVGKGGNITYAGRELHKYLKKSNTNPKNVVVTTLDSDNRPHKQYFAALTYLYCVSPDTLHVSFQPVAMFTNNIWDVPTLMRVVATGNSMYHTVMSLRPHVLRNFSAHAQGMEALIKTDFWSVRTIVEDGHQFWRSYFRFDGNYEVYPMHIPIYQDAVLAKSYLKSLRAQFNQVRRWAWGASDIAYVAEKGFFSRNKVPKANLTFKFLRLIEGHVSWATEVLIITTAGFVPVFLNPQNFVANQLPLIASRIQTVALSGIIISLFFTLKTLPPRPVRYKRHRTLLMIAQWAMLPIMGIFYRALSTFNAQTRLLFGKYLDKFDVTEKTVIGEDKKKVT